MSKKTVDYKAVARDLHDPTKHSPSPPREMLYCSFCGKREDEVAAMVKGPSVAICEECVLQAVAVIREKKAGNT